MEVKKDKIGKKGAKVSTNLNLAGKYVAIIPDSEFITVSQKINDNKEIERLKNIVSNLHIKKYGIILRTSAIGVDENVLKNDITDVINTHKEIIEKANIISKLENYNPTILFEKGTIIQRLLVDLENQNLKKIKVNDIETYEEIKTLINNSNLNITIELIEGDILNTYNLNKQIEKSENRKVWLKCGGFITIDKTEALTAIDVNTGKFTGKENIEQTVLKVNSEATIEIAKQLRLRDIGGIIVIDYIDMDSKEDEEKVKNLLIESLKLDRAKTQVVGFTKLHLLEMTRKHICS